MTLEAQKIQRAIQQGLSSVLSESEVAVALKSWSMYANESGSVFSGINAFARDVCQSLGKPDKQRDLAKALNRALIVKDNVSILSNDSSPDVSSPVTATPAILVEETETPAMPDETMVTGQIIVNPEFLAFQSLMNATFEQLDKNRKDSSKRAKMFLEEVIDGMPWSETQQHQIKNIIETGSSIQRRAYKADQLKTFYKHFRTWVADEFGEGVAAELINRAVSDADETTDGKVYSTKNFV